MKLTTAELLEVYKTTVDEVHRFLDGHQGRVSFFMGLLSAVFAGTVAGVFQASAWYHLAFLAFGPVIILALAQIGINGVFRLYQQFLEMVTVRAKIEQALGLTEPPQLPEGVPNAYWADEPILAPRHLQSRRGRKSSADWLDHHKYLGYHRWTMQLFRGTQLIALVLLVAVLVAAYCAYSGRLTLPSN